MAPHGAVGGARALTAHRRSQATGLTKRKSELAAVQNRLLNAYLAGPVDEETYQRKACELERETAKVEEALAALGDSAGTRAEPALRLFDWSQSAADVWLGSNNAARREILDAVCLNRELSDLTLVSTKRKPFDVLAEGLDLTKSRGDRI